MEVFEYIRTTFHVMKAFATQDKLLYIGLGILGLFIIWSVLSLLFCHELKVARIWDKMRKALAVTPKTPNAYFEFSKYFKKLPTACARKWRKFEQTKVGVPSDYLTQYDMLDGPVMGGVQKQNRSMMKFAIWVVTFFVFLLSFASLGANEAVTAKIIAEALLVPFILFLLYRINYYIYTAMRQHEYRMCVEEFQDFVDFLDNNVDLNLIFEGQESLLDVSTNCYINDACVVDKKSKQEKRQVLDLSKSDKKKMVSAEEKGKKDFYRNRSGNIEIRNQQEFVDALAVVEKLLDNKEISDQTKDEKTQKVAELMEAMNKYRNKNIK